MISLLIINYRSAELAAQAVASARATTAEALQVVIVDNSCDPAEARALESAGADVLLVSEVNRGYAGGINDGRARCTGEILVLSNPDVVYAQGALDQLAAAVRGGYAAAGPALHWDAAGEWLFPPADLVSTLWKVDELLACRSRAWFEIRDRRRAVERSRFWERTSTGPVAALSGAVIAIAARTFDEVGGMDERFALYFEEIDLFRRLAERRLRVAYVPEARCRHLFSQSAGRDAATSASRYIESARRYLEKWSGPWFARVVDRLGRTLPSVPLGAAPSAPLAGENLNVEASSVPSFAAAGGRPAKGWDGLPAEVVATLNGPIYVRIVSRTTGKTLQAWQQ